ncbi:MAG TPA: YkgJ family cysteine cluster protein [Polyangiaceae bacterium]|jgi:Fe-S-cluster containining protein|nr:YkgJ family cysteine cluster protein [Polyangiaceae bacterium]
MSYRPLVAEAPGDVLVVEAEAAGVVLSAPHDADTGFALAHVAAKRAERFLPMFEGVACREGCDWCCHGTKVDVVAPEALAIARYLVEGATVDAESITAHAERLRAMTLDERLKARVPCPLLDTASGSCTVHDVRPLRCRSHHSLDASSCETASVSGNGDHIVDKYADVMGVFEGVVFGQKKALAAAHLDYRSFDLVLALDVALNTPDAALCWAQGERVFDAATHEWPDQQASPDDAVLRRLGVDVPKAVAKWRSSSKKKRR